MAPSKREQKTPSLTLRKAVTPAPRTLASIHELEINLREIEPRVWRRFAARSNITLAKLHDIVQIVMGWTDSHLHCFVTRDGCRYAPRSPDMDLEWNAEIVESRWVNLSEVLPKVGARLVYEYDFGDGWAHEIQVAAIRAPEIGVRYPRCLAGARACPPEDCGGPHGYAELLAALTDTKHPEHEELAEWVGGKFDAEAFDLGETNGRLARHR